MIRHLILSRAVVSTALLALVAYTGISQRPPPTAQLHPGQILFYRIDFKGSRSTKTESRVISPQTPPTENITASALLQVEIVEASATGFRMKTYYSERDPSTGSPQSSTPATPSADKMVELLVSPDGTVSQIKGVDQLSPAQQFAWNDWLSRFTSPMAFAKLGAGIGQKWESAEREMASSPIASLFWVKKYQYTRDEPCTATSTSQLCAVVLVRATLRQKSAPKNSTPEDYKLRNLKTRGTASGQNESVLYISRSTGLLVRSMEDAQQSMDAIIALTDGSNEIHYTLNARSHSEVLLLHDSPTDLH